MKFNQIFILGLMIIAIACNPTGSNEKKQDTDTKAWEIPGWQLVWHDEFDGSDLDPQFWLFETGGHGWGNDEEQYYTDRPENAYLEDGKLIISAKLENYEGKEYTSARINSKIGWKYKRIDVKAKLPRGVGTWPAIWMLPDNWDYGNGSWPDNGEIDIMEHVGYDPGKVHASIHTQAYNHKIGTQKSGTIMVPDAMSTFHVYSMEWYPDSLKFFLDETQYFKVVRESDDWRKWPFNKNFHLLLNIAVGGGWGGVKGIDNTIFPANMEIDYVRVYEPEE